MKTLPLLFSAALAFIALPQTVQASPGARIKAAPTTVTPAAKVRTKATAARSAPRERARATTALAQTKVEAPFKNSIEIKANASDPNMTVKIEAGNALRISGTTHGPTNGRDVLGLPLHGVYAKSVSFSLDIDKARTTDAFGRQSFKLKNRRLFQVSTEAGWSAQNVADRLAKKVNALPDFKATVTNNKDGSATLAFQAR